MSFTCGISSIDELCDDREGGGSNGEEEERVMCDHEQVTSFPETLLAYETVQTFVYMHSIRRHYKQNILNLKLILFHPDVRFETKQLSVADYFGGGLFACKY
jgi:hypothetical protein